MSGAGDTATGEVSYCHKGTALSLFPATYTYVTATVVEPNAKQWDPQQNKFVYGPLESRVFYQFAGMVPDFNRNGVDDLLDIRTGASRDRNVNGVPDEAEARFPWIYSFHVGATHPLADLNEDTDSNVHVRFDLGYRLTDRIEAVAMLGLSQFTAESAAGIGHPRWVNFSVNAKWLFPTVTGLNYFLQAGPGVYRPESGAADGGFNVGAGAQIPIPGPFKLDFGVDYHQIADGVPERFLTFQLGVLFR
jgi:hypothetical protein